MSGMQTNDGPADRIGDTARASAAGVGDQAKRAAGTVRAEAVGALSDLREEGGALLEATREQAMGFAETQAKLGADQAEGVARAVHSAASELEQNSPGVARYVHEAATAVDGFARTLRDHSPAELMGQVEHLARRQPAAFFGVAVLAGFALARFAKSSADDLPHGGQTMGTYTGVPMGARATAAYPPPPRPVPMPATMPATMASASLGGAVAHRNAEAQAGAQVGAQSDANRRQGV